MTFQATTKVKKPLAAASKMTTKGNRIILDGAGSDSYIENKATGVRAPLKIDRKGARPFLSWKTYTCVGQNLFPVGKTTYV